jgi:bisphosphoglycerate-independent phosphoglycerate mutase (AlkP superfamily)
MKLTIFDLPSGFAEYVELPSGRCINVHVANLPSRTEVHVQANSEQWPQEYSDTFVHCKKCVHVMHSASKGLTHADIEHLQDRYFRPYEQLTFS